MLNSPSLNIIANILRWRGRREGWRFKWNTHYSNSSPQPLTEITRVGFVWSTHIFSSLFPWRKILRFCISRGRKNNRNKNWKLLNFFWISNIWKRLAELLVVYVKSTNSKNLVWFFFLREGKRAVKMIPLLPACLSGRLTKIYMYPGKKIPLS